MHFIRLNLPFIKSRAVQGVGDLVDPASIRAAFASVADWTRRIGSQFNDLERSLTPVSFMLNDDQAGYIPFTVDTSRGILILSGDVAAAGNAMVGFRVGTSAYCDEMAQGLVTPVTVGTGTLAGTTGVNGDLTIRADTGSSRLYIENRTGAERSYVVTFVSLTADAGDALPDVFVTV